MNRAEAVFYAIDVLFHRSQNNKHYDGVISECDKSYNDDHSECKGDYYYKDKAVKKPVFVNIHGGGFVAGDKKHRVTFSELVANEGYFVFNINYRLAPKYPFPAILFDCYSALNHLTEIQAEYNLDLDTIVISGDSSGAYVSAETVATLTNQELHDALGLPECKVKIAGFVGYCGPYDIMKMYKLRYPFGIVRNLAESMMGIKLKRGLKNAKDFEYYQYLSPIDFVNKDWCPTLLIYSKTDVFCHKQGEYMTKKLEEYNVDVNEYYAVHLLTNHCFHLISRFKSTTKANAYLREFLITINSKAQKENICLTKSI